MTPRRWAAGVGAGLCIAVVALGPVPAAAAGVRTAQLSIAIDNGRDSVAVGDVLNYTVTVTNIGDDGITGLVVTQSMPPGLAFGSADNGGIVADDAVTWTTDLAADQVATFASSMTVTPTDADVLRLASVACAAEAADGPPVVCAAHSDLLPTAPSAAAVRGNTVSAAGDSLDEVRVWLIGGAAGAVLVAGSIVMLLTSRGRSRRRANAAG